MSDRHEMQAAGTHPAPCARHCESTAYEIEIRRLRHDIERHVRIATEATQEAEQLRERLSKAEAAFEREQARADAAEVRAETELDASRHELDGAKKAARAQALIIESLQQQRAHLHAQRDKWIEARNTLESERAANARLADELSASREREARMMSRDAQWVAFALEVGKRVGCLASTFPDANDHVLRALPPSAALAEGAQG